VEETPRLGPHPEHVEEVRGDPGDLEPARVAGAGHHVLVEVVRRQRLDAPQLPAPVQEVGRRDRPLGVLRRRLVERHDPLGLGEGQRLQEQRVHAAPHGGADADAEGEEGHHGQGEAR